MVLTRKLRMVGSSIVITIPADIARVLNYQDGDIVGYEIDSSDESILIRKVEE